MQVLLDSGEAGRWGLAGSKVLGTTGVRPGTEPLVPWQGRGLNLRLKVALNSQEEQKVEEAVYVPAPGHPEPDRLLRRRRAVLPEGRAQSTATVRAESSSGLSQCTQHAPHAPKKRHCTRRPGSDRAPTSWSPLAQQNPNNGKLNPRTTVPGSLSCPPLARHYGKPVNFRLVDGGGIRQN